MQGRVNQVRSWDFYPTSHEEPLKGLSTRAHSWSDGRFALEKEHCGESREDALEGVEIGDWEAYLEAAGSNPDERWQ